MFLDTIFFEALGFPDLRGDANSIFLPKYTGKDYILNGEKPRRDYLANLFTSTPDYEDVHKKLFYSTYFGAKAASFYAAIDVFSQKSRNPTRSIRLVGKSFFYIGGAFMTYGAMVGTIANLRGKKDDILNHTLAGASIGFLYGMAQRTSAGGCIAGAACAIAGTIFKWWYVRDRPFIKAFEDGPRELNFQHGGWDMRSPSWYMNTHNTKARSERYNW